MALFTGIGDFFRGAFGEDAEEKKRRKQREAQEAAARKQQAAQPRPQIKQSAQQNVFNQGLETKKAPQITQPKQLFQQQAPAPKAPVVASPAPRVQPQPKPTNYQDLGGVKDIADYYGSDLRKLQGELAKGDKADPNMVAGLKKSLDNRRKELTDYQAQRGKFNVADTTGIPEDETKKFSTFTRERKAKAEQLKVDQTKPIEISAGNGNKAKFTVAQYAQYLKSQPKEQQVQILQGLTKQIEQKDAGSKEILEGLNRNGVLDGDLKDFYQGFIDKSGGGLLRAGARFTDTGLGVLDALLPGEDQRKVVKAGEYADKLDEDYKNTYGAYTKSGKSGESLGSATKGGIETAATIATGNAAGAGTKALPWIERLGEGGKVAQFFARNIPKVADDLASGVADMATNRGRGDKVDPVQSLAVGTLLNRGSEAILGTLGKRLFGRKVAGAVEDQLDDVERGIAERTANVDDVARQQNEKEVEELQRWNQENIDRQLRGEEPLPRPTFKAPEVPDPIDVPTFQYQREVQQMVEREQANLERMINSNPGITQQQVEQARAAAQAKVVKLAEDMKNTRYGTEQAVADQAAQVDEAVTAQQATNADVAAQQAARTEPVTNTQSTSSTGSPEVNANNAYDSFNKEAGIDSGSEDIDYFTAQQSLEKMAGNSTLGDLSGKQTLRIPVGINEKTQGALASGVTNTAGKATGKLMTSQNPVLNAIGQTLFGFNKKSTLTNEGKALVEQVVGRRGGLGKLGEEVVNNLETPIRNLDETVQAAVKERVFKAFELYNNGQIDESLALIKSFAPQERAYFDGIRDLNKLRNNLNRATMSRETIDQYANGMHMPRLFDQDTFAKEFDADAVEAWATSQNRTLDLNPNKRRKQLEEISEELREQMLRDPAKAAAIRTEIALHNKAVSEYAANVSSIPGAVSDTAQKGYLEIPDMARYGNAAGKFVRRDFAEAMLSGDLRYKSEAYRAVNTLLNKYQTSIMGKVENALRKGLTVYNPATRLGNRGANLTQGAMAGFNLPEMAISQQHFIKVLKNGGDEWTRLAKTFGAIDDNQALARFSGVVTEPKTKALRRAGESYADVDTAAKVAMFKWRIQRGSTPEEAARFVNRALPNIGNSGEVYSFFSRLPVLGTPFRAIQPEVIRALASTASRNTVPFLVAMGAYTTLQNMSWDGVPEEERRQIQERFGSGQTPFAAVNRFFGDKGIPSDKVLPSSWSFNAGALFGSDAEGNQRVVDVDPRRLMGMYSINLGGTSTTDSLVDQAIKASPVNVPVNYNDGKFAFAPQNIVASRSFSPLWQALIDRDFRGKSVQDPEGKIYNADGGIDLRYMNPETGRLEEKSDLRRMFEFLGRSYVPQANDVANLKDASDGKENFYGQQKSLPQAVASFFGLKGEEFTDERLTKMNEQERFFQDKAEIDEEVKGMSAAAAEAYKRLTGYHKLREKVPNEFEPGSMRDKKAAVYNFGEDKWKEYAAHPELYNLMVRKKQREAARDGKPIQPEFDERLSESFRKQLIQNKMVAPGDDAELDQRMYSTPEWDYYNDLKDAYKKEAEKYYPKSDKENFDDESVAHDDGKFPTKPDMLKAYSAEYKNYLDGKRDKPVWNDALTKEKEQYNKTTLDWTNKARAARGLPAITWDVWNNPTFGFDETPSGSGFGFGKGGGGGSSADYVNTLTELTNFGDSVKRYEPVEAQAMPNEVAIFQKLMAGSGGGKAKPKLGASAKGQ